jgi:hypothetical protein
LSSFSNLFLRHTHFLLFLIHLTFPCSVTSGTGVLGYRVALSLLEAGHKDVRVGIWKGDRQGMDAQFGQDVADVLEEKGAEIFEFDWSNGDDYEKALQGVKTVFCTIPHLENWSEVFPKFLGECKRKKIEFFVKVSFLRQTHAYKGIAEVASQYRDNVPFVSFHGVCDDLLEQSIKSSRISYCILCCSHLMATPLLAQGKVLREEHKYLTASYGMGVNYVSPNDVADAALVVLLNQKPHRNSVYNLTGPGPVTDARVAVLLSRHYGTNIEHVQLGYHDYETNVKMRGLPDWQVRDSASFERMKASGVDESPHSYTKDLKALIGNDPETFKGYLANKSCMRPGLAFP